MDYSGHLHSENKPTLNLPALPSLPCLSLLSSSTERNLSRKFRGNYRVVGRFIGRSTASAKIRFPFPRGYSSSPQHQSKRKGGETVASSRARGLNQIPSRASNIVLVLPNHRSSMLITFPLRVMLIDSNRLLPLSRAIFHDDNENHGSSRKRG